MTNLTKLKAAAERWLDDPDISLTLGGSMVACEEMQADLRRYVSALEARVASAEGALERSQEDRPYIIGWNDGFDHACSQTFRFPTMLRKMWSGTEVQRWLDDKFTAARAHFQSRGGDHGRD